MGCEDGSYKVEAITLLTDAEYQAKREEILGEV